MTPDPPPSIYQAPKCFVTYGTLGHVDSNQGSRSRKPWANLSKMGFIQKVDLIMSQDHANIVQEKLDYILSPSYSRVTMTLGQILEKDFFTDYVKTGSVLMMSQGRKAVDDVFTLEYGSLNMYLGKESYERAGLVGKTYGAKGNRKLKPRWVVTYDLKSHSMLHGKKGFDRLVYACHHVFAKPLTWILTTASGKGKFSTTPQPVNKVPCSTIRCEHLKTSDIALRVDRSIVSSEDRLALESVATDLYEWLSLVRLGSTRIMKHDRIDAYLSRYESPEARSGSMEICLMSWQGLVSSEWLYQLAMGVMTSLPQGAWFSLAATELSSSVSGASKEVVLLRPDSPSDEYLLWELQSLE
ncbi:hypothetical protein NLU13_8994 [Sarocladium strictum]|uniref:Uncharacterized protein n=1 Tax=Sarocladium strictum TaxID=5046 RepID=A0AA39G9B5_SARSR|nr:hypothetical protein NLU13_8994 [Sarocladium strictum]